MCGIQYQIIPGIYMVAVSKLSMWLTDHRMGVSMNVSDRSALVVAP